MRLILAADVKIVGLPPSRSPSTDVVAPSYASAACKSAISLRSVAFSS
jgi:hypothetical protein